MFRAGIVFCQPALSFVIALAENAPHCFLAETHHPPTGFVRVLLTHLEPGFAASGAEDGAWLERCTAESARSERRLCLLFYEGPSFSYLRAMNNDPSSSSIIGAKSATSAIGPPSGVITAVRM